MADMLATLEVSDTAREVAAAVLWPERKAGRLRMLLPALAVFRLLTAALLPGTLRDQYGLPWTGGRRRAARFLRCPPQAFLVRLAAYRVDRTLSARRTRRRTGPAGPAKPAEPSGPAEPAEPAEPVGS